MCAQVMATTVPTRDDPKDSPDVRMHASDNGSVSAALGILGRRTAITAADLSGTALAGALTVSSRMAARDDPPIQQRLVPHGGGVRTFGKRASVPLVDAAKAGNVALVEELLRAGAHVDTPVTSSRVTPLLAACTAGHVDVAQTLLDAGANIAAIDVNGEAALAKAVRSGVESLVKLLLARGAPVDAWDNNGASALSHAAVLGNGPLVSLLLQTVGASLNAAGGAQWDTPLCSAVRHNHATVVQLLLDGGAETEVRYGATPLMLASSVPVAAMLLKAGAKIEPTCGGTAVSAAICDGHDDVAAWLMEQGARIDVVGPGGTTCLALACRRGKETLVQMLLDRGAVVNTFDSMHRSPLHAAADSGNARVVALLAQAGADVNAVAGVEGAMPLDAAVAHNDADTVRELLRAGACVNTKSALMARATARGQDSSGVVPLLLAAGVTGF